MKKIAIGILAHVDSGKTTLSEALLYTAGVIKNRGRVDHKNAFLDTNLIEKERGITIFAKQAVIVTDDVKITLVDTPGHVDFSAETERTLGVLDYAVLVVNGAEGVQSHTETLWKLLERYNVPTLIFVNKMDVATADRGLVLKDIKENLSENCTQVKNSGWFEDVALCDDMLLEEFLASGEIKKESLAENLRERKFFPCFFGSALKNEGIEELLLFVQNYTKETCGTDEFGARIFKISQDEKGNRLTHLKVTSGKIGVKTLIKGDGWEEKVNEIRIYSGAKYESVQEAGTGEICAVLGFSKAAAGEVLGVEKNRAKPILKPLFSYSVKLPVGIDAPEALQKLRLLQEEETQLEASWNEQSGKIEILVMGDVQLEIIKRLMAERFNMPLEFEDGSIIYKETVKNTVEGVGHFEPLRHYAEVHLKIEPAVAGSGLIFESMCSEDELDKNWQRLILTHLAEKQHVGVLCGYPITDVKITLVSGKAHKKHTEGGDFRQATYRALRQGLMQAESVLLEPWMNFNIKLPSDATGRAMTELEQMGAKINPPDLKEDNTTLLSGRAPLRVLQNYQRAITAYTKGRGVLNCHFSGYDECTNSALVISERGYNPEADVENTPDSVFCEHGAGFAVKWDKVFDYMHIPLLKDKKRQEEQAVLKRGYVKNIATDDELLRIFEQTYGKTERKPYTAMQTVKKPAPQHYKAGGQLSGPEYLLIDGYNIIFADDDLKKIAAESLEDARVFLIDRVCNWQALKKINVILVFDAYKVKGTVREVERVHGVDVVYTREAETADAYIEKTSRELSKHSKVRVATSDALEQMIIFGNGAYRITAAEFMGEMRDTEEKMRKLLSKLNRPLTSKPFSDDMTMPETD